MQEIQKIPHIETETSSGESCGETCVYGRLAMLLVAIGLGYAILCFAVPRIIFPLLLQTL